MTVEWGIFLKGPYVWLWACFLLLQFNTDVEQVSVDAMVIIPSLTPLSQLWSVTFDLWHCGLCSPRFALMS